MKLLVYGLTVAALLSIAAPAWTQSQSNPPQESAPSTTTPAPPTTPLKAPENVTSPAPGRPHQAATPTDAPPASEKAGPSTHPAAAESKFPWEAGTAIGTFILAFGTLHFMRK